MKESHDVVYQIARRIAAQHPNRSPLTFAGELGEIAGKYDIEVMEQKLRQDIAEQTGREVGLYRPPPDEP